MYNLHFMDLFIHHVVMMVVSTIVVMGEISIIVVMDVVVMVTCQRTAALDQQFSRGHGTVD